MVLLRIKSQGSQWIACFFPFIIRFLFRGHGKQRTGHPWLVWKGNGGEEGPCLCALHSNGEIMVNAAISLWYSTLETCLQELCASPPSAEENGDQFHSPPQKHWCPWGGLWHCHDSCAWASQRCGQLFPPLAGVGGPLLPSVSRWSSQTLRPCPGVWNPAHLPPADCPQAWRPVFWEEILATRECGEWRQCREYRGAAILIWEGPSGQNEIVVGEQKCKKWTFQAVASMTPRKMSVSVFHLIYLSWGKRDTYNLQVDGPIGLCTPIP